MGLLLFEKERFHKMMRSTEILIKDIENLGYDTAFGSSNPKKTNQQLWIYKPGGYPRPIAKVSLMLQCRVNTMFNGVGKNEAELLKVLTDYATRGLLE